MDSSEKDKEEAKETGWLSRIGRTLRGRFVLIALISLAALPALVNIELSDWSSPRGFESVNPTPENAYTEQDERTFVDTAFDSVSGVAWSDVDDQPEARNVEALLSATPDFDCMIEPWAEVSVRSPVSGRIDAIHFERADRIEAGDLLVELDAELAQAELDVAAKRGAMTASLRASEARRSLGTKRSGRAHRLFNENAMALDAKEQILTETEIARFELEEAKDELELAELQHAREMARYEQRRIRSPISGIVADRLMSVGEVVDEETMLEIAQLDPLRVEVVLPALEFGSVRKGMKAAVIPEIPGDQAIVATVRLVDGLIDSASGTFGVELELPNPDHAIPGGLRCRVQFVEDAVADAADMNAVRSQADQSIQ
ncbi:MAG: efflux RND transporter periplasmic adaptor subunit [Myxococcota bacterium]